MMPPLPSLLTQYIIKIDIKANKCNMRTFYRVLNVMKLVRNPVASFRDG